MTETLLHRFTADEYHLMAETGVIAPDAWVELVDGQVIDMLPIGPFHGDTVTWLTEVFVQASCTRYRTSVQNSLRLSAYYEPQPDLMLVKRKGTFYRSSLPGPADVFLLVEVADSTLLFDRKKKVPAYAQAGIPEVWLINVPDRQIEVYRTPIDGGYVDILSVRPGESLSPQFFPDVQIDTQELLAS